MQAQVTGNIYKTSTYREYNLDVDEYHRPKMVIDNEAIAQRIVRLILLEPGTNPLHPEMGVGLVSHFRYILTSQLPELKRRIMSQISQWYPEGSGADIDFAIGNDHILRIKISLEDSVFTYDTSDGTAITVSDLAEES